MSINNNELKVWEHSTYTTGLIFILSMILFLGLCASSLVMSLGIRGSSLFLFLIGLFIFIGIVFLLRYFLINKSFYKIFFTNYQLIIKQTISWSEQRFNYSDLQKIELTLIKRPIWNQFHNKQRWRVNLFFELKIFSRIGQLQNFLFKGLLSESERSQIQETKEQALSLYIDLEQKLRGLQKLFPTLIQIKEQTQNETKSQRKWINLVSFLFFIILLIFFLPEETKSELIQIYIILGIAAFFVFFIVLGYNKYNQRQNNEEFQSFPSLSETENFTRIILAKPAFDYSQQKPKREILINAPKLCPFCNSLEVESKLQIMNTYAMGSRIYQYIEIFVCKEHSQLKRGLFPQFRLLWKDIAVILTLILLVIAFMVVGNIFAEPGLKLIINEFSLSFASIGVCVYLIVLNKKIENYKRARFLLESFNGGSALSVKSKEWVSEFRKINPNPEILQENLDELRSLDNKLFNHRKALTIVLIALLSTGLLLMPLREVVSGLVNNIFLIVEFFLLFLYSFISFYAINTKLVKERSEFYFKKGSKINTPSLVKPINYQETKVSNTPFKFCPNCGAEIKTRSKFCTSCGKPLVL